MSRGPLLVRTLLVCTLMVTQAMAQSGRSDAPVTPETLDLLKAERLDTVALDQRVYFSTPDGGDAIAGPGTYRVERVEPSTLRLIPEKGKEPLVIQALATQHLDAIAMPVALYVPDVENAPHVVLLLPGGQGLEAVGSYNIVRTRGAPPTLLSPAQLHEALIGKKAAIPPPTPPLSRP